MKQGHIIIVFISDHIIILVLSCHIIILVLSGHTLILVIRSYYNTCFIRSYHNTWFIRSYCNTCLSGHNTCFIMLLTSHFNIIYPLSRRHVGQERPLPCNMLHSFIIIPMYVLNFYRNVHFVLL